jgi:hypothetical protein
MVQIKKYWWRKLKAGPSKNIMHWKIFPLVT